MQSRTQRSARLVAAVEDLVGQEAVALQAGDFNALPAIQERLGLLVTEIVACAGDFRDEPLQGRIRAVQTRRSETTHWLEQAMSDARAQMRETEAAQRRTAIVVPAYGRRFSDTRSHSQLSCVG